MIPIPIAILFAVVVLGVAFMLRCVAAFHQEQSKRRAESKANVVELPIQMPAMEIRFPPETIRHNPRTHLEYKPAGIVPRYSRGL